jgi:hypothetical protein
MIVALSLSAASLAVCTKSRKTGDGPHIQRTKIFFTVAFGGINLKANIEVGDRPVDLYFVPFKQTFLFLFFRSIYNKCALRTEPYVALYCIYMMTMSITLLWIPPIKS